MPTSDAVVQDRLEQARAWVEKWRVIFGLTKRWKITCMVADEPCGGNKAWVYILYDKPVVELHIARHLIASRSAWSRLGESTIIHELLHVLFWNYDKHIENRFNKSADTVGLLKASEMSEELVVRLEKAIQRIRKAG